MGSVAALIVCAGIASGNTAGAQTPDKAGAGLFTDTFEADTAGWVAYGPHAKVSVTTDSAHVKTGKGALAFNFTVSDKLDKDAAPAGMPFDVLLRPTPDGLLTKMKALTFWARSDIGGGLAITMQEKEGGRYMTLLWLPKDQWQRITLTLDDFWLADDKNDPKDPDGKLDLDKVENIGILNVWSFLALSAGNTPEGAAFIAPVLGQHTLWLDDFAAVSEAPPVDVPAPALPDKARGIWIDAMRRAVLGWLPLGNIELSLDKDAPLKTRALRAEYTQGQGTFVALIHDMRRFNLTHQDHFSFAFASAKSTKLSITLEEKGGARYSVLLDVPGDSVPILRSIPFSDFIFAQDGPQDADGKLDLDQIKTLTIVDISGSLGLSKQKNTLWIGPISAVTVAP